MTSAPQVAVRPQYTRSVNLERDIAADAIVRSYIPTTRAVSTLRRIAETLVDKPVPRAWSLVGPYGSGKSSFAVFLANLLAEPGDPIAKAALDNLSKTDPEVARSFQRHLKGSRGYCRVLLTGSPEPLARRLLQALEQGATAFWSHKRGASPKVLAKLRRAAKADTVTTSKVLSLISELQAAVAKAGGLGVLVVLDELGKFLEYEARHYGANDIYLLQSLAELAYQEGPVRLIAVVLLHQAFEQYAQGLGESLRNEWSKVQGRFENIPFLEAAEQVLRVVAAAFKTNLRPADQKVVKAYADRVAKALAASSALPAGVKAETAKKLFESCYPLHPLAALLLPTLCQRVAQNERTLFSYLGSHEPSGFRDSLSRLREPKDWVMPSDVYDYFILNQPRLTTDLMTQRRWAEVVTAVERLGDGSDDEVRVLKTVGLLNIIGGHAGLKASKEIIDLTLLAPKAGRRAADALVRQSIVQYRKFSGEYRVWQGSDFDLDAAVEEERAALGKFSLSEILGDRSALDPVVVRRHTIRSGALRYFDPVFADAATWARLERHAQNPRLVLYLSEGQDDVELLQQKVLRHFSDSDVVALVPQGGQLRTIAAESLALERIQATRDALNLDPVAKREFKDRYEAAVDAEGRAAARILDVPGAQKWYWRQELLAVATKRSLQVALSDVLDRVYDKSPIFQNELINRDAPSSTANAARNKLLQALLKKADQEDLGIDKFPAEKAMYRALFKATGLHRQTAGVWQLSGPNPKRDPYNLLPVWAGIDAFLVQTEAGPLPFTVLQESLLRPPFGVKRGVLPLLYVVFCIVHQHELAIYEDGNYTPYLTEELVERLARRPETFSVQRFRLDGLRASLFREYARAIHDDEHKADSLLAVAQPLVQFVTGLPEFSRKTKTVSTKAQEIRTAVLFSRSPATMLFRDLPLACGYPDLSGRTPDDTDLAGFSESLLQGLRELKGAYRSLLHNQQELLRSAVGAPKTQSLGELRRILNGRFSGLERYTVDVDELTAFVRRLTSDEPDDQLWLDKLLLFLGRKPASKWEDRDRATSEFRLSDFTRRLNDLEKLRVHREGERLKRGDEFSVVLLRAVQQGETDNEAFAVVEARQRAQVAATVKALREKLTDSGDEQFQLAVLATFANEFLGGMVGQGQQQGVIHDRPKRKVRGNV